MEESTIVRLLEGAEERINAATVASESRIVSEIHRARSESKADLASHEAKDDARFAARRSWPPRGKGWAALLAAVLGSGGGMGYLLHHCQGSVAIVPVAAQTQGEVRR